MKYLKIFKNESDYQAFKGGGSYITPNLCYIEETKGVKCNPYILPPALAGDVAYWDGSKVKTTPLSSWNTSLGTAIGVVVVPEGFAPDKKIRIISLKYVYVGGNPSPIVTEMVWNSSYADTSLTNYTKVPTTNNKSGSTSTGESVNGYLPSDMFTGATSFVDPKTRYYNMSKTPYIPSPYLGDSPNPEYYKTISGNNALSDFNGLSNTETLVGLGSNYVAANAAWKYKDGSSNLQWYLPGIGELGYLMPRFNVINKTITALDGVGVPKSSSLWSSSEHGYGNARSLNTTFASVAMGSKSLDNPVRPFAILD